MTTALLPKEGLCSMALIIYGPLPDIDANFLKLKKSYEGLQYNT
jgi:hypothetical protein